MATIKRDGNYSTGEARVGLPISFFMNIPQADLTANTWYRLCASGNDAQKVSETELNLGALPSWIVPNNFSGWGLKVLNEGYNEGGTAPAIPVRSVSAAGVCKLQGKLLHYDGLPATGIEWVLLPEILFRLSITLKPGSDSLDIGVADEDVYSPAVRKISDIPTESFPQSKLFRSDAVDRFFYRFPTVTGPEMFEWGEHESTRG